MLTFTTITMPAMTPLHSWALILALLGLVALIVKTALALEARQEHKRAARTETPDDITLPFRWDDNTDVTDEHIISTIRYTVPTDRVYDWAAHGDFSTTSR